MAAGSKGCPTPFPAAVCCALFMRVLLVGALNQ